MDGGGTTHNSQAFGNWGNCHRSCENLNRKGGKNYADEKLIFKAKNVKNLQKNKGK
jgi:hypothetical protein